jgi:hypothetical protein
MTNAMRYVSEIRAAADTICHKIFHIPAANAVHILFCAYIHTYRRNKHTHWHIIYNWNPAARTAFHYQNPQQFHHRIP